jgi:O-antigen ligase
LSLAATLPGVARADVDAKLVDLLLIGGVSGGILVSGFVLREPAPYEIYMAGLIGVSFLVGLRISRVVAPLLTLMILFNIGGWLAMTQMAKPEGAQEGISTVLYLLVSLFLALTSVFFAAVTEAQSKVLKPIFVCWTVTAVLSSIAGIVGYFGILPGTEIFTRYDRAAGGFQDPNVFGPFLVLPAVYLIYRMIAGRVSMMPVYAIPLLIIAGGIFLSFSRGAWGAMGLATILLMGLLFLGSRSNLFRLRILLMGGAAVAVLIIALLVLLQIPQVQELFTTRAKLAQDYDSAHFGRFARYGIGFLLATEKPLGIGPLVFGTLYGEDTHDIWLKTLMDYGWLGFASYLTITIWTIAGGARLLFRERPWQPYLLCAYVVYLAHIGLGTIIDIDHWRHVYLLIGLIWGCMGLEWRRQQQLASQLRFSTA